MVSEKDPGHAAAVDFLLRLGRALHTYGYPAPRLEEVLAAASKRLGLVGQFFSTPTSIFAAFGPFVEQRTYLIRVEPGETNLAKLSGLYEITKDVISGGVTASEGAARVDELVNARSTYGPVVTLCGFALASAAAARFLNGGWMEVLVAGSIGAAIGSLSLLVPRLPGSNRIFEPLAAFLASIIAAAVAGLRPELSVFLATLAGLIVLVPGLTVTVAMRELATRHLVSGTARLASALMTFVGIGFGVAVGNRLMTALLGSTSATQPTEAPSWSLWIALLVAPVGFAVLLQARPRDVPWIVMAGVVAYFGGVLGTAALGPEIGLFGGALAVGLGSNFYARVFDRPSAIPSVPGILLLVPGSVGFRSLASLLDQQVLVGVETAFNMILMAVSLAAGLLIANVVAPAGKNR